jgi:hypothetical protein
MANVLMGSISRPKILYKDETDVLNIFISISGIEETFGHIEEPQEKKMLIYIVSQT